MQATNSMSSITIEAPARLHLGFLDLNGDLGRQFGSIGMAIDQPATRLTITRKTGATNQTDTVTGPESNRIAKTLANLKSRFGTRTAFDVTISEAIPAHAGLGSGTQLALAVGTALANLENQNAEAPTIGESLSRGARSAIGIGAFQNGGFIIDGGKDDTTRPPPILVQAQIPEDWRVVLVLDPNAQGVHGDREKTAFANLPPMAPGIVGEICRLTLMQMLPGVLERNLPTFGNAISRIQSHIGNHFADAQGGDIWASQHVAQIVKRMADLGAMGIGQSSWGPTGFAFVESQAAAENLYQSLIEDAKALSLDILISRGRNHGASIDMSKTGLTETPQHNVGQHS